MPRRSHPQLILRVLVALVGSSLSAVEAAAPAVQADSRLNDAIDRFRPIAAWSPPNSERLASGRPGATYWQQRVDYDIHARLDEPSRTITGRAAVTYHNHSPDALNTLWFEVVQNRYRPDALSERIVTAGESEKVSLDALREIRQVRAQPLGMTIGDVSDGDGNLSWTVEGTFLRAPLRHALLPGGSVTLALTWSYVVPSRPIAKSRSGWEALADGEAVFQIGEWYPRAVAYTDYGGWRLQPIVDLGEFTLDFGDFRVALTVPGDHVVSATGELRNPEGVLSARERERLACTPVGRQVDVVTAAEASAKRAATAGADRTWIFEAHDVRDFAWASSRRYIETVKAVKVDGRAEPVRAAVFYPPEAAPLWGRFGVAGIEQALVVYGHAAFPYPYPVIQAAYGPTEGMEYPMLAFSAYAPDGADGKSYSLDRKHEFLWVLIHEVGHNWFPMVVDSDERRWGWMDEGLNSFVEHRAMLGWSAIFDDHLGDPRQLSRDVLGRPQAPIMTPSDLMPDDFSFQYRKTTAALLVLREAVLGRERFDRAFAEYGRAWSFKRPLPEDFFRMMEQGSGEDLSWFWRGWFYDTVPVDQTLVSVTRVTPTLGAPDVAPPVTAQPTPSITAREDAREGLRRRVENEPGLADPYDAPPEARARARRGLTASRTESDARGLSEVATGFWYVIRVTSLGIVMPVPLRLDFLDGSSERLKLPAQIWRNDAAEARALVWRAKPIARAILDPDDAQGNQSKAERVVAVAPGSTPLEVPASPAPAEVLLSP